MYCLQKKTKKIVNKKCTCLNKKIIFLYTNIPNFMTQDQFICAIQLIKKWGKKGCKI